MKKLSQIVPVLAVLIIYSLSAISILCVVLISQNVNPIRNSLFLAAILLLVILTLGGLLLLFRSKFSVAHWQAPKYLSEYPTRIFFMGIWFGWMTGIGQLSLAIYRKYFRNTPINSGVDITWYWPLGEVILFMIIGFFVYLFARKWEKVRSLGILTFVYSFLAIISLLLDNFGLAYYAVLLLSLGIASACSQLLSRYSNEFEYVLYYSLGWLWPVKSIINNRIISPVETQEKYLTRREFVFSLGALFAGAFITTRGLRQLANIEILPENTPSVALPNVLLLVMDTVRAENTSLSGYQRDTTPNLKTIANDSVFFPHAISPASWTLPAHASFFTGRYPHELSTGWLSPLDKSYPTFTEILSQKGYKTAGFVSNTKYCSREFGLNRGFTHYEDYHTSIEQIILGSNLSREVWDNMNFRKISGQYRDLGFKDAGFINHSFLSWLDTQNKNMPFFAFLNYNDAHSPYAPPLEFANKFKGSRPFGVLDENNLQVASYSKDEVGQLRDAYDGSIAYVDQSIGDLVKQLTNRDLYENTLLVIVGDHGEQFGEHQLLFHGNSLYSQLIHVPLLIKLPGPSLGSSGQVMERVSLRDIPATILDILGLTGSREIPGNSLRGYFDQSLSHPDKTHLISYVDLWQDGWKKSLIEDKWHYIKSEEGPQEIYNLDTDPKELVDLSGTSEGQKIIRELDVILERDFNIID